MQEPDNENVGALSNDHVNNDIIYKRKHSLQQNVSNIFSLDDINQNDNMTEKSNEFGKQHHSRFHIPNTSELNQPD